MNIDKIFTSKWFEKISRAAAWVLFVSIILSFISGYGKIRMLHGGVLPIITLVTFFIHTLRAVRTILVRWKIWNRMTAVIVMIIYLVFFGLLMGLNSPPKEEEQLTFTTEELVKYDGKNGNKAYVAVDGVVYDLTNVFKDGKHKGFSAGQDQTASFYSHHTKDVLTEFSIVGKMK